MKYFSFILLFFICAVINVNAASQSDSVLETPKGTVFELRHELVIPANRNFILLGKDQLNESFNEINQTFNDQDNHYHGRHDYYHYDDYLYKWQRSVGQSYRDCLERHRTYYSYGGDTSSNNTIINQDNGNTNVIINNQTHTEPSYGSYIEGDSWIAVSSLSIRSRCCDLMLMRRERVVFSEMDMNLRSNQFAIKNATIFML